MSQQQPDHSTHQPIKVSIPTEDDLHVERPRMPVPSIWQVGVQVTNKADPNRTGTVRAVDHSTRQFRLVGSARTMWDVFDEWNVLVEKTPAEKAKDEARELLAIELESLDADDLAAVQILCDDEDPAKALAKLGAMRKMGILAAKHVETKTKEKTK